MSLVAEDVEDDLGGFPRVSGDEPTFFAIAAPQAKFSPRERG